jgi:hypothetical protein
MTEDTASTEKPGSQEARQLGCTCPVVDNHYGQGIPGVKITMPGGTTERLYWISASCPLHGTPPPE